MFDSNNSSVKLERRKSFFLREISLVLEEISLDDPELCGVGLTRVEFSKSKGCCHIYFSVLPGINFISVLKVLKEYKPSIRSYLAKTMSCRRVPKLMFFYDERKERETRMHNLLENVGKELESCKT